MTTTIDANDLLIRVMPTPNPFAMKFILNASLKDEGKATFNLPEECGELPLARDLFSVPGVKQIYFFQNTLTVTHSGILDDDALTDQVENVLRTRFPVHNPDFGGEPMKRERQGHSDPRLEEIEEILDRTIRPGLQADGGDIELLSLEDDELKITYQGACGGCPSAMMGTLDAIQGILRNELGADNLTVTPV